MSFPISNGRPDRWGSTGLSGFNPTLQAYSLTPFYTRSRHVDINNNSAPRKYEVLKRHTLQGHPIMTVKESSAQDAFLLEDARAKLIEEGFNLDNTPVIIVHLPYMPNISESQWQSDAYQRHILTIILNIASERDSSDERLIDLTSSTSNIEVWLLQSDFESEDGTSRVGEVSSVEEVSTPAREEMRRFALVVVVPVAPQSSQSHSFTRNAFVRQRNRHNVWGSHFLNGGGYPHTLNGSSPRFGRWSEFN